MSQIRDMSLEKTMRLKPLALLLALPPSVTPALAETPPTLDEIVVSATRMHPASLGSSTLDGHQVSTRKASSSDTASLLADIPGVNVYGAGGVSSLPVMHGLADDRLRIKVDA